MSNTTSTEPKPQAPHAAPDGNAIASLVLGILGITALSPSFVTGSAPGILITSLGIIVFICSVLAVILGSTSISDAYKRGERGSTIARVGADLGWIVVYFPVVLFAFLAISGGKPWMGVPVFVWMGVPAFVLLGISVLLAYYMWPKRNGR